MTTTYDATQLATVPLYETRFLLGDTGPSFTFQDEEINFFLGKVTDACKAAWMLAERRASQLEANGGSYSIGDLSVSNNPRAWKDFAKALKDYCTEIKGGLTGINIGPGGAPYQNLPHIFAIGMHDAPGTLGPNWPAEFPQPPVSPFYQP